MRLSFPALVRLSLIVPAPRHCRPLCSSSAGDVKLFFDKRVRPLLSRPRRQCLVPRGNGTLSALRSAILERVDSPGVEPLLEVRHGKRPIETDADLADLLSKTQALGVEPQLTVAPRAEAELPQPEAPTDDSPSAVTEPQQMLSFFTFHETPLDEGRLPLLALRVRSALAKLNVRGTVYLAAEGVNAQLAAPVSALTALRAALGEFPELAAAELNLGDVEPPTTEAFRRLVVRQRPQVLTDGLPAPLDWDKAGTELPPEAWDEALATEGALLLDCRNDYESEAGRFEAAEPLGTSTFAESFEVLRERLADVPRDAPILTFCTGGIRCVKVNAFLEQELGFSSTMRLKDGINGYLRHLRQTPEKESKWVGENFVFDRRTLVASPRADHGEGGADEAEPGEGDGN